EKEESRRQLWPAGGNRGRCACVGSQTDGSPRHGMPFPFHARATGSGMSSRVLWGIPLALRRDTARDGRATTDGAEARTTDGVALGRSRHHDESSQPGDDVDGAKTARHDGGEAKSSQDDGEEARLAAG